MCPAALDVGGEAADRGGELQRAAGCVGDGAAEWVVCEPIVHLARMARAGRLIEAEEAATFAPAIISREASSTSSPSFPERVEGTENLPHSPCPVGVAGRIEIVLACGRRVVVDNGVDSAALARVLAVLERP